MSYRKYETCRNAGVALARRVSAYLKAQGFTRQAVRGSNYRHGSKGFSVSESGNGTNSKPTCAIWWHTGNSYGDVERTQMMKKMADALEASGKYEVRSGWYVTEKEEA